MQYLAIFSNSSLVLVAVTTSRNSSYTAYGSHTTWQKKIEEYGHLAASFLIESMKEVMFWMRINIGGVGQKVGRRTF